MESSVQSESRRTDGAFHSSVVHNGDRIAAIRQEMEYLNTIGKRFVAALDRFQVHRALLAALQELYSFSACSILLKGEPFELSIIPCYPLNETFLQSMIARIVGAAEAIDFPHVTEEELAASAYLDAPDELTTSPVEQQVKAHDVRDCLNIPLTVENRIIGILSLFDEHAGTFDTDLLKLTTMIADYAAVAMENVRLREREMALWRQTESGRQRLELILSSMAEGLLITDAKGKITLLNRSAQRLLEQAQLDLTQEIPLHAVAHAQHNYWLHQLSEIIDQALSGQTVMSQELIAGESGETVPLTLSISAAPLYDTNSTDILPVGVVAVLNDITASKQIEKLKDEFVSVVSHELRTPLTTIKGYTQHLIRRLERRLRQASQQQLPREIVSTSELPENYDLRNLHIVQSQAEHLERLVNDLLDLSRVQWGNLHLHVEKFNLVDVLAETIQSSQASAEQHTIFLDLQVQDSQIVADKARVEQVIGNVLDNAVKYSPQGGQISVRLGELEGDYLISIIDQGIGINPEYLDHIFERFYRVRNTASRQFSGIGLGLYVTRAIIEQHGGRIWVTNNQGLGCTFSFTLPHTPAIPKPHIETARNV
jgi:two-component system phosphate regulon sensor histidine kinase PhoR